MLLSMQLVLTDLKKDSVKNFVSSSHPCFIELQVLCKVELLCEGNFNINKFSLLGSYSN